MTEEVEEIQNWLNNLEKEIHQEEQEIAHIENTIPKEEEMRQPPKMHRQSPTKSYSQMKQSNSYMPIDQKLRKLGQITQENKLQAQREQARLFQSTFSFHPKVSNPSQAKSSKQVTARLMQQAADLKKRKDEQRLVKEREARAELDYHKAYQDFGSRTPNTERLLNSGFASARNLETRRQESRQATPTPTFAPAVNHKSEKILKNSKYLNIKVEERLLQHGAISKDQKAQMEQIVTEHSRIRSYPVISRMAKNLEVQGDVSTRLNAYQQKYRNHKNQLALANEPNFDYTPCINPNSRIIAPRFKRSRSAPRNTPPELSFKPKLDQRSLKIASRMGSPAHRLTRTSRTPNRSMMSETQHCTFQPNINNMSRAMTSRHSVDDRNKELYSMSLTNRFERENIHMANEAKREGLDECTFSPNVTKTSRPASKDVVSRLYAWNQQRTAKAQEIRERNQYQDLEQCTFKPVIQPVPDHPVPKLSRGTSTYVQRQMKAREWQAENIAKLNKYTGDSWKHQTTRPEPFQLSGKESRAVANNLQTRLAKTRSAWQLLPPAEPNNDQFLSVIDELHNLLHE